MSEPMVLPINAGTSREPAVVFEAPSVTWKYRGTENMIWEGISCD